MDFARIARTLLRPASARKTFRGAGFIAVLSLMGSGSALAAGCGEPAAAGRHSVSIESDGVARSAVYVIPSSYTGQQSSRSFSIFTVATAIPKVS